MADPYKVCLIHEWEYEHWLETGEEPCCDDHGHKSKNWAIASCFGNNACARIVGAHHAMLLTEWTYGVKGVNCQRQRGNGLAVLKPLPGMTRS